MRDLTSERTPAYAVIPIGSDWTVVRSSDLNVVLRIPGVTLEFAGVIARRLNTAAQANNRPLDTHEIDTAACGAWLEWSSVYRRGPENFDDYAAWSYTVDNYLNNRLESVDG